MCLSYDYPLAIERALLGFLGLRSHGQSPGPFPPQRHHIYSNPGCGNITLLDTCCSLSRTRRDVAETGMGQAIQTEVEEAEGGGGGCWLRLGSSH
jgi:hypothetical protein